MTSLVATLPTESTHLQAVLDALPVLVSFVTAEERYALVNKAYEDWFGLEREALIGRTVLEVVGEAAYEKLEPFVRRALSGEALEFEQYDVPYRYGGIRDIRVSFVPRHNANGGVAGYVALITDITAARRQLVERERLYAAEQEARKEAERFRLLVELERDGARLVAAREMRARQASDDARGRTEFLLTIASALVVTLDVEVMLQRLVEAIAPARAHVATVWMPARDGTLYRAVHAPLHAALADGAGAHDQTPMAIKRVMATGRTLHIKDYDAWTKAEDSREERRRASALGVCSLLVIPICHERHAVAVLAVAQGDEAQFADCDVALFESAAHLATLAFENARLFSETERLRREAEDATAEKDRFLARVSHDLRNPLTAILGWSSLLHGQSSPKDLARGLEVIERNAKSQVRLIEDLLDVSRIATGKLALEFAAEDVRVALDTALDPARLTAEAKGVTLVVHLEEDLGIALLDPNRFRQVVWNLVANAVKFTPAGGCVRVDARRILSTLRVVVSDTGRGIAPSELSRIFGTFQQAEPTTHRSSGLGLGLAIARHLVELHGGRVQAESEGLGKGATFTVELPIRVPQVSPDLVPIEGSRVLAGARVLVVDDQEDARYVVTAILEREGAAVTVAASADEAHAAFLRTPPDIVVSDIGMPGKDGRALLRDIRNLSEECGCRTPAVALSAFTSPQDRASALKAGFDEYLVKPVNASRLVVTLGELLRGRSSSA